MYLVRCLSSSSLEWFGVRIHVSRWFSQLSTSPERSRRYPIDLKPPPHRSGDLCVPSVVPRRKHRWIRCRWKRWRSTWIRWCCWYTGHGCVWRLGVHLKNTKQLLWYIWIGNMTGLSIVAIGFVGSLLTVVQTMAQKWLKRWHLHCRPPSVVNLAPMDKLLSI